MRNPDTLPRKSGPSRLLVNVLPLIALFALFSVLSAEFKPVQLIEGLQPLYPEQLKEEGVEGSAKIKTRIDTEGRVTKAEVVSASHPDFGEAAREVVLTWKFSPATDDGVAVSQTVTIPLRFNLSVEDKLNFELGTDMFIDINQLTDRVRTWSDVQKWYGYRNNHSGVVPYPEELKGSGISEVITVRIIISPDGYVLNPQFENLKNKELMMPALQHLAGVRFDSPKVNGEKVYLQQKVKLTCSEDPSFGK